MNRVPIPHLTNALEVESHLSSSMTLSRLHLAMVRGHSDNIKYSEWRVLSKQDEVDILGSNGRYKYKKETVKKKYVA